MAATIVLIADALVAALNAYTFSPPYDQPLLAVRSYAPRYSPEQLSTLRVTVSRPDFTVELGGRSGTGIGDFGLQIGIQQRTGWTEENQSNPQVDALMLLAEEIAAFCLAQDDLAGASCIAVEAAPAFDEDTLRDDGTFTAVLVATFKAPWRALP